MVPKAQQNYEENQLNLTKPNIINYGKFAIWRAIY